MSEAPRPPLPPFDRASAIIKVRAAENGWNSRDPERVALAYTADCHWRNRSEIFTGRAAIIAFLTAKWSRENGYRLIKEYWAHTDDCIAVRFAYEWHDAQQQWYRAYGNENWRFADNGLMVQRHASINDIAISQSERLFHWPQHAPRPDAHPGLTDLGL